MMKTMPGQYWTHLWSTLAENGHRINPCAFLGHHGVAVRAQPTCPAMTMETGAGYENFKTR